MKENIQLSTRDKALIILNNLIPLVGILFFGWKIPPVLFFYWFDSELAILELMGLIMSEISKEKEGLFPKEIRGIKRTFYTVISYLIISIITSFPAFFGGLVMYFLIKNYISSPFKEIFSQKEVWIGIGLNTIIRGYNIIKNIKSPIQNKIKQSAEEKYTLLVFRFFAMFFLASFFQNLSIFYPSIFILSLLYFFSQLWK